MGKEKNLTLEQRIQVTDSLKPILCSYTEPKSLISGCIDGIKELVNDKAALGVAATITALYGGHTALSGGNVLASVSTVLGEEIGAACAYGMYKTAIDNCNTTWNSSPLNLRNDSSLSTCPVSSSFTLEPLSTSLSNPLDSFGSTPAYSTSFSLTGQDSSSSLFGPSNSSNLFDYHDKW